MPTFAYEKRLSRIETLRLAITYITFMDELIEGASPVDAVVGEASSFHKHGMNATSAYRTHSYIYSMNGR